LRREIFTAPDQEAFEAGGYSSGLIMNEKLQSIGDRSFFIFIKI